MDDLTLRALRERYLEAQLAGNRREALRLLLEEGIAQGASIVDLQLKVIQEAQREIGELWQRNRISIAQEHLATAISQLALAHLLQHATPQPPNHYKVLVACVEGELHDFPARLVADALDIAGYEVRFLGANVPTDSLIGFIAQEKPDLLALSVTMTFNLDALREAVARVRKAIGTGIPIIIGGHACRWNRNLTTELEVDATAGDAAELLTVVRRLSSRERYAGAHHNA